jgi:hypothetical protein
MGMTETVNETGQMMNWFVKHPARFFLLLLVVALYVGPYTKFWRQAFLSGEAVPLEETIIWV